MIYARIKKGKITDFPIETNEALSPIDGYFAVTVPKEPSVSKGEKAVLKCVIFNGKPYAEYAIVKRTINSVLSENIFIFSAESNKYNRKFTSFPIADQKSIVAKIDDTTNLILEIFAAERHYDTLQSCLSYANSSIMEYRKDAQHASDVRDLTWNSVIEFKNKLKKDEVPVPVGMIELKSCFENVQWD